MKSSLLRSALLTAGLCLTGISHAQTNSNYQFTDLYMGMAYGINDSGIVVGSSYQGAMIWNNGNATLIPNTYHGTASAINNSGEIVGTMMLPGNTPTATVWQATPTGANFVANLPAAGTVSAFASGVNNAGVVVGGFQGATVWHGSTATLLNDPGTTINSQANGINASGVIVGTAGSSPDKSYITDALEWTGSTATVLPGLGLGSSANAINNAGVVVGASNINPNNFDSTAVEWKGGKVITLNSLGGAQSQANAINNQGQVVGFSTNAAGTSFATLWNGATAINLNNYLPSSVTQAGWVLQSATGINNQGWITGDMLNTNTYENDAFLLKVAPVPEPATWAMLLIGLGMVVTMAKRRRI